MVNDKFLGEFETLVMMALMRLGEEAYGVPILAEIEARAGRPAAIGSVYAALDRLEAKALVASRMGAPTAARGGRRKKFFTITAEGERKLADSLRGLGRMASGVPELENLLRIRWKGAAA
ncbi:MAG: hypothetical protein Tsb0010_16170 [Parvularculaceae bacterium]